MAQQKSTQSSSRVKSIIAAKDLDVKTRIKVSPEAFSTWVRSLLQGWRQGTVAVKGRADVKYSGKKPWKQKGTGRARAGTARSPLWRGGGVTFGPQPRTKKLSIPHKVRQGVLNSLLWGHLDNDTLVLLDWNIKGDVPKTSEALKALKGVALENKKITLFLPFEDKLSQASFANIPTVNIVLLDQANAYNVAQSAYWVVLKKDFDAFKKMVKQWI